MPSVSRDNHAINFEIPKILDEQTDRPRARPTDTKKFSRMCSTTFHWLHELVRENKAGYTANEVACGWAGTVKEKAD